MKKTEKELENLRKLGLIRPFEHQVVLKAHKDDIKELQHYFDSSKGLNCTDLSLSKISNKITNLINKEFNLKLKTVDSAQMDEFILDYLKTIFFKI